jgi:hypothetical protein
MKKVTREKWFDNAGGWRPQHDLAVLRAELAAGFLNDQDKYGLTALALACASGWQEGIEELLRAGADTELREHRTGATALHIAVDERHEAVVKALVKAGANPDAGNYWGVTPRVKKPEWFNRVKKQPVEMPPPHIQNAEHLADHYWPRFEIPDREERETLKPGQAVNLYVYGPRSESKQDTVKVRITAATGRGSKRRYTATVETPLGLTHLPAGTPQVEFDPEHVATVFVPRPKGK